MREAVCDPMPNEAGPQREVDEWIVTAHLRFDYQHADVAGGETLRNRAIVGKFLDRFDLDLGSLIENVLQFLLVWALVRGLTAEDMYQLIYQSCSAGSRPPTPAAE